MSRFETVSIIKNQSIPRGTIAALGGIAAGYVSDFVNGKRVPGYAEMRIVAVVQDIAAFMSYVNGLGFDPDLSDALRLQQWITRWKQQAQKEVSPATVGA